MKFFWITLGALAIVLLLVLLICLYCFFRVFYSPRRKMPGVDEYFLPNGGIYEPYRESMFAWMKETRHMRHEDVSVRSFDGLTLRGKYYERFPGAPIELMMHGYRGDSERDLCGWVQRCFSLGHNALTIDQRAAGDSDGNVISFGINERKDCVSWVRFLVKRFGKDVKIILTGISMGATTVMMAAGMDLPENVVGVIADCGYTSPRDIIRKVIHDMGLPVNFLYPFVKLSARLFGGFDLEESSATEALKRCRVPVLIFHGEADAFIPCEMSKINYAACAAPKRLYTVPGADHGLSYALDMQGYVNALKEMETLYSAPQTPAPATT